MIKVDDNNVSTTAALFHHMHIFRCIKHSKHSMLGYPVFNNVSMENYKREILPTYNLLHIFIYGKDP